MRGDGVQKALVHEHIVQVLSQPINLKAKQSVKTISGNTVELRGFGCAHFAALQYISRLLSDSDFLERAETHDKKQAADLVARCGTTLVCERVA